jgi:DNA-binding NarL/FixJ family response regulator
MSAIKVSIVEDQEDIREGMRFLINQTTEFSCLSVYQSAEDAVTGLSMQQPDLVIMDINLPGMTGIECIRRLKPKFPALQFIMFTVYEDSEQVFEALTAGASGYLLKKTPPERIISALKELHEGGAPMSTGIARKVISTLQERAVPQPKNTTNDFRLSPREYEILDLLARGLFYKEIASQLSITTGTVRQHIHKIYEKLHVQNRTEALNKLQGR